MSNHYPIVTGHQGILRNEKADQAAKIAAEKAPRGIDRSLSLVYLRRTLTEATRPRDNDGLYRPWRNDPTEPNSAIDPRKDGN